MMGGINVGTRCGCQATGFMPALMLVSQSYNMLIELSMIICSGLPFDLCYCL